MQKIAEKCHYYQWVLTRFPVLACCRQCWYGGIERGGRKDNVELELSKTYSKYVNWFGFAEGVIS